ncbi:alpha/beta fold hydrolase [Acinetobacter sp. WZC-1]|uniref:alpha/beta fold hydrolase n=1 Tax=Acinetobacter sp. WZC-1 TaxID=3459034 RepID=UPI00403D66A0
MEQIKNKWPSHKVRLKNLSARIFNGKSLVLSEMTAYEVIDRQQQTQIRYYAASEKKYREPLVFIAPLAINMAIYDLYPYRSLIRYFTDQGFDAYLIDWGKLDYRHRFLNFLNFIDEAIPRAIDSIRRHAGTEQISLHGWSLAGILALLYTARHQPTAVRNLIILGSPIDSYQSGNIGQLSQKINEYLARHPKLQHAIYNGQISEKLLHTPGIVNSIGFKILDPRGWYEGHKHLLQHLDDQKLLHEHATLGHFLNNMVDYPGAVNQDMLLNVWLQNPLKHGAIQLSDQKIDLKNISCPLLIGAGRSDQMVTAAAVRPLTELTGSSDVTFTLIPGGHLGLMSSQKSADEFWPVLARWLSERSSPQ